MQGMAGHSASFLYKEVQKQDSYLILSVWTDKNAFDAFVASEAFAKVTNWGKEQVLSCRPKHQVFIPA
jgi:heme-degrading monooxygenase HmoA